MDNKKLLATNSFPNKKTVICDDDDDDDDDGDEDNDDDDDADDDYMKLERVDKFAYSKFVGRGNRDTCDLKKKNKYLFVHDSLCQ